MPTDLHERLAVYHRQFREDLYWWVRTDRRMALRLLALVEATLRDPFAGIGKPEPLRGMGPHVWSRRIDEEHRLVYVVERDRVTFVQARFHYER